MKHGGGRGSFTGDKGASAGGDHLLGTLKDMSRKTLEMEHPSLY